MAEESSAAEKSSPRVARSRRYVTGTNSAGKSCVVDVGDIPASARWTHGDAQAHDFWVVPALPAPLDESSNPPDGWVGINAAPQGGVIGRLITWPPGFQYPMHATPTLDLVIIVSGQLELGLECEQHRVVAGDVVVQRGTAHSWRNPGPDPCTFAVILLDAAKRLSKAAAGEDERRQPS